MFVDKHKFRFTEELEAAWKEVREECLALPQDSFEPWVQRELYGRGWNVYGFIGFGEWIEAALSSCPRTASVLAEVPGIETAGFSRMAPGTHIKPHTGWGHTVYRLHLPLVVPPFCGLRVGSETRSWSEGECLIFDDTYEHEAWNWSRETRIVLLLDFLRPDVSGRTRYDYLPEDVKKMSRRIAGK